MIKFKPRRVNSEDGRTPILYDREIDEFAEAVLKDYRPELLKEPGKIDTAHFLEYYYGANIRYLDIYNEDEDKPIRALTTFTEGNIEVFDRENDCVSCVYLPARTVVYDNEVTEKGNEGIELYSGGHESGHLSFHLNVFVDQWGNPYTKNGDYATIICCQRNNIENTNFSAKRTLSDWQEHQADYYSAAIIMPNRTFRPMVNKFLIDHGVHRGSIKLGRSYELDILANDLLPQYIQDIYGVSKRAAKIKLRKSGFVYSVNDFIKI